MNILIVEDHLMMREAIQRVCLRAGGHAVVGETEYGAVAIHASNQLKPDLVILDLGLPDMDGFAVATAILANVPTARVLVLTAALDHYTVYRVGKLCLHGFMDKSSNTATQLHDALRSLSAGKNYFSAAFLAIRADLRANSKSFEKMLSGCEQKILSLVGEGLDDQEIGLRMNISPATAQTHRRNILRKLEIKGTPKLAAFALNHGFTRFPSRSPLPLRTLS